MIGFYMKCDPTYINNSNNVTKTFTGASILMAANNDAGSFNVHIIGSFADPFTAGFSIPFLNASMIPSGSYLNSTANGDLAHEIGHLLGLSHTHQYSTWNWKCLTECVSRTRTWPLFNLCPTRLISNKVCEATGDGLRDTQADDNLVSNNSCSYNVTFGNDEWGDSYDNPPAGLQDRPNVHNIMSYNSATDCVDQFSRLQIAVMLWTAYKKLNNHSGWANPISTFDDYEPDNESTTARSINVNETQQRNFHQQWNKTFGAGYFTQCDVDWVRFTPTCSQIFDIQTSAITGRTNANTRLTIFNSALNQLAQNDDISTSNHFSKITLSLVSGQTYFIRVENMSTNVTGYYNLNVAPALAINGDNNFCTSSNNYTIPNLPPGATVLWSVTPSWIATPNTPNSTQTTLSKNSNGIITLQAVISNLCGGTVTISKTNIAVGAPVITSISSQMTGSCNGPYQDWNLNAVANIAVSSWLWTVDNPINNGWIIHSPYSPNTRVGVTGGGGITISATNVCGTGTGGVTIYSTCHYGAITASPNPATSDVTIAIDKTNGVASENITKNIQKGLMYKITVTDQSGVLKKQYSYPSGVSNTKINLSGLMKGMYTIQAFDSATWNSVKVIKE